ncbi:MAG: hypothetical protein PUB97_00495 [Ruminococcus sp.]|nr:hypothetical protein [Ruminococcus sp.]
MIYPTNKLNYAIAQNVPDTIQKPVELVIERKSASEPDTLQNEDNTNQNGLTDLKRKRTLQESFIRTLNLRIEPEVALLLRLSNN